MELAEVEWRIFVVFVVGGGGGGCCAAARFAFATLSLFLYSQFRSALQGGVAWSDVRQSTPVWRCRRAFVAHTVQSRCCEWPLRICVCEIGHGDVSVSVFVIVVLCVWRYCFGCDAVCPLMAHRLWIPTPWTQGQRVASLPSF